MEYVSFWTSMQAYYLMQEPSRSHALSNKYNGRCYWQLKIFIGPLVEITADNQVAFTIQNFSYHTFQNK